LWALLSPEREVHLDRFSLVYFNFPFVYPYFY
jgi:hypothetical protein